MPIKTAEMLLRDAEEVIRRKNAELSSNRREIASLYRENDTAEAIRKEIWNLATHNPEPPKWISRQTGLQGHRGCPITIWSDWHYGEKIDPDQVNNVNEYNMTMAKKRIFRLYDTTVDLAFNHMGTTKTIYPGIIVCLGGDMIGGDIHEELMATNDRTPQQAVNDLTDLIASGIEHMATKFGRGYVP